jgi:hypothetical protein
MGKPWDLGGVLPWWALACVAAACQEPGAIGPDAGVPQDGFVDSAPLPGEMGDAGAHDGASGDGGDGGAATPQCVEPEDSMPGFRISGPGPSPVDSDVLYDAVGNSLVVYIVDGAIHHRWRAAGSDAWSPPSIVECDHGENAPWNAIGGQGYFAIAWVARGAAHVAVVDGEGSEAVAMEAGSRAPLRLEACPDGSLMAGYISPGGAVQVIVHDDNGWAEADSPFGAGVVVDERTYRMACTSGGERAIIGRVDYVDEDENRFHTVLASIHEAAGTWTPTTLDPDFPNAGTSHGPLVGVAAVDDTFVAAWQRNDAMTGVELHVSVSSRSDAEEVPWGSAMALGAVLERQPLALAVSEGRVLIFNGRSGANDSTAFSFHRESGDWHGPLDLGTLAGTDFRQLVPAPGGFVMSTRGRYAGVETLHVVMAATDETGVAFGLPASIADARDPQLAVGAGGVGITYNTTDFDPFFTYASWPSVAGEPLVFGPAEALGKHGRPSLAGSPERLTVSWQEPWNLGAEVWARDLDETGPGSDGLLATEEVEASVWDEPRIAVDGEGRAVAVWWQELDWQEHFVFRSRWDGIHWSPPELLGITARMPVLDVASGTDVVFTAHRAAFSQTVVAPVVRGEPRAAFTLDDVTGIRVGAYGSEGLAAYTTSSAPGTIHVATWSEDQWHGPSDLGAGTEVLGVAANETGWVVLYRSSEGVLAAFRDAQGYQAPVVVVPSAHLTSAFRAFTTVATPEGFLAAWLAKPDADPRHAWARQMGVVDGGLVLGPLEKLGEAAASAAGLSIASNGEAHVIGSWGWVVPFDEDGPGALRMLEGAQSNATVAHGGSGYAIAWRWHDSEYDTVRMSAAIWDGEGEMEGQDLLEQSELGGSVGRWGPLVARGEGFLLVYEASGVVAAEPPNPTGYFVYDGGWQPMVALPRRGWRFDATTHADGSASMVWGAYRQDGRGGIYALASF